MDNEKLLKQAIEYLKGIDVTEAESVQINNTKYDDGSTCIEVGVSFPAKVGRTVDEELNANYRNMRASSFPNVYLYPR